MTAYTEGLLVCRKCAAGDDVRYLPQLTAAAEDVHSRRRVTATGSFRDLEVWREAMALVLEIYTISRGFPSDERFSLTSQLRRAAISIPSNIAEGARRKRRKAFLHHLDIALGSQAEVDVQLELAQRLGFCRADAAEPIEARIARIGRMLNGLIRSLQPPDDPTNRD